MSKILPYVYKLTKPSTGEFYIGSRCKNKCPPEEDLGKTLLLSGSDDGVGGTVNFYLNIPSTTAFRDEEIVIKDISTPLNPGTTAYEYNLNIAVQTNFDPVTQSQLFSVLSTNRTLVLRFIQDNLGVYRWFKIG